MCFTRFLALPALPLPPPPPLLLLLLLLLLCGSMSCRGKSTMLWSFMVLLGWLAANDALMVAESPGLFTSGITSAMKRSALDG